MENLLVLGHFWFKFWGGDETYLVPPGQNLGGGRVPPSPAIYAHEHGASATRASLGQVASYNV